MKPQLKIVRYTFTPDSTIGSFFIQDKFECYTLEDAYRPIKIPGETCIPYGVYEIAFKFSDRYKMLMPYITEIPGFKDVFLHTGNTKKDTAGCPLLGQKKDKDIISGSRLAFAAALPKIKRLWETQHTYIEVTRE